jgi:hypothetical protein
MDVNRRTVQEFSAQPSVCCCLRCHVIPVSFRLCRLTEDTLCMTRPCYCRRGCGLRMFLRGYYSSFFQEASSISVASMPFTGQPCARTRVCYRATHARSAHSRRSLACHPRKAPPPRWCTRGHRRGFCQLNTEMNRKSRHVGKTVANEGQFR